MSCSKVQRKKCSLYLYNIKLKEKCSICGSQNNLEFHHINPEEKLNTVHRLGKQGRFNKMKLEIKKCIILCSSCHCKIHKENNIEKFT